MDVQACYVEIEYLDGVCARVRKADVKLLINKNNEHKRKYVHYWMPDGDSEPTDFSNMDSLKKFKISPVNMQQKGLYYCKIVEKTQQSDVSHFTGTQNKRDSNTLEMVTDPIELVSFKSDGLNCDIIEPSRCDNDFTDTSSTWETTQQHVSDDDWSKSNPPKKTESERKTNVIPKSLFPMYFSVSEYDDGRIKAKCNLCARNNLLKFVRSYGRVTSNLLAHMKREHPQEYLGYKMRHAQSFSLPTDICVKSPEKIEKVSSQLGLSPPLPLIRQREPIIFRKFFKRLSVDGDKLKARCNYCGSIICSRKGINSNLVTHLKRMHPKRHAEYQNKMPSKRSKLDNSSDFMDESTNSPQNSIEEVTVPEFDDELLTENTQTNPTDTTSWGDEDLVNNAISVTTSSLNRFDNSDNEIERFPTTDLFERYFNVLETNEDEIKAECKLCASHSSRRRSHMGFVTGHSTTKSIFTKHVKQLHPLTYIEYLEEYTGIETKNALGKIGDSKLSPETITTAVTEYIISEMLPHSIIDNESFRKLIKDITGFDDYTVMNCTILKTEIEKRFQREKSNLIDSLENVKYVCATTDIWTSKNGSFLGSTLHWIEPITLQRKSAPFFRRQLKCQRSVEEVAEQFTLMSINYGIKNKIVAIVTNNGWNYKDAFKSIGISAFENEDIYGFQEVIFESSLRTFSRCITGTHILSAIATEDVANALMDAAYREIHSNVFDKLNSFWHKAFEMEVNGDTIVRPTEERCNSLFECLQFIVNAQLKVPTLTQHDLKFLTEFTQITKPIAAAIDHLMKPNCYYAAFLPTIYTIDHAYQKLLANEFEYCMPLLQSMHAGFRRRFDYCFNLTDEKCKSAVLATCTHPFFKTRWLSSNYSMDNGIIEIVTNAVKDELQLHSNDGQGLSRSMKIETGDDEPDDFEYYFASDDRTKATEQQSQHEAAVLEVQSFLEIPCEKDKNNLEQLGIYKIIREVFVRYNTILPSSAPVERLFSFEKIIASRSTSDENLSEMVFLLNAHNNNNRNRSDYYLFPSRKYNNNN